MGDGGKMRPKMSALAPLSDSGLERVLDDYARWYAEGTWTLREFEESVDLALSIHAREREATLTGSS